MVIETIWCLIKTGHFESRSGLIYGPFNLLYGFATLLLTLSLYRFRNKKRTVVFAYGMAFGSVYEYICSWLQEKLINSRSWDYSEIPLNINGRICLLYSVFWGLISVLWMCGLYPRISNLLMHIPMRIGKISAWILLSFTVLNIIVTALATYRWTQRLNGFPPSNGFYEFVDDNFSDQRMESVFANMEFSENSS